ncbi:5-methylcytosine restriction system specificity protein McrC [Salisediminibacterium halotolerans]|uniref:5-methylcytosine restriction system specificity protein McrC n=1 Tax=Salisediminibacterium halotolerans TaxID=517425 RepID=UPI000F4EEA88|nr:5-methylcytosine-specific restriction endonuclease system specificity protein McrC [Salisediminibacterium halotolerans]
MSHADKIPVKNIYAMLCYAWNELDQSDRVLAGSEKFDNIYNLFARIYINGTKNIIKRGLHRYYIEEQAAVSTLKGKINVTESVKQRTLTKRQMICEYDEFSEDILLNQIVKATLTLLLKTYAVDDKLKHQLKKLRYAFSDVADIRLTKTVFTSIRYNRNNHYYRMLLHISQLIVERSLTTEENQAYTFSDFVRDGQMAKLYEKFILNFYHYHLNKKHYKVHAPQFSWQLDERVSLKEERLLPRMQSDIVVENKLTETQLIIDAKYYAETLLTGYRSETEKLRSNHLYQLLTYMQQSDFPGEVNGMLLYPTIEEEINADYSLREQTVSIRTLNLNAEWDVISARLKGLIT